MRISTLDPISFEDVEDLENAPYCIEGEGDNALKIYFQSEHNKAEYLQIPLHGAMRSEGLRNIYDDAAASPITGTIN
jgi:YHS domain-containing protein